MEFEINPQIKVFLDVAEHTDKSIFLTGIAGVGKSCVLKYFRKNTEKNLVVLAPTGVAAVNVGGETIHSFFGFSPGVTLEEALRGSKEEAQISKINSLRVLVIDEISMVRADLLDCIDAYLQVVTGRDIPFAGIQMIMIGDLYQLSPVLTTADRIQYEQIYASPYFFSSVVFKNGFDLTTIQLLKNYRQLEDDTFKTLLNAVRDKSITPKQLSQLNERHVPGTTVKDGYVYIAMRNDTVSKINHKKLAELQSKLYKFQSITTGQVDRKATKVEDILEVKVGAQVMFAINKPSEGYMNGTVGKIVTIEDESISVQLPDGQIVAVAKYTWAIHKHVYDVEAKTIKKEKQGSFTQYPLRLSWAISAHLSQSATYDKVIVDFGEGAFSHGQAYVALSRCRSLEGTLLVRPVKDSDIIVDRAILKFFGEVEDRSQNEDVITVIGFMDKKAAIKKLIKKNQPAIVTYKDKNNNYVEYVVLFSSIAEKAYKGVSFLQAIGIDYASRTSLYLSVNRIAELSYKIK